MSTYLLNHPSPGLVTEVGDDDGETRAPVVLLRGVHKENPGCKRSCAIHSPSDHHMRYWPLLWRSDRYLMERLCPHGIGHPDPDHLRHDAKIHGEEHASYEGVHGCDGCCREEES